MIELLKDLTDFLKTRKKLWMMPIVVVLVLLGSLLILTQESVVVSFIYALF